MELVLVFGICLLASILVGSIVSDSFQGRNARIDYTTGVRRISEQASYIANTLREGKVSVNDKEKVQQTLQHSIQSENFKVIISDLDGKVLYKSANSNETQIDIYSTIKNAMETVRDSEYGNNSAVYRNKEYVSFYPVNFTDARGYLIVSGMPQGEIVYDKNNNNLPGTVAILVTFLSSFYFITNKKMKYIEVVSKGLLEISKGNLDYRIKKYGNDELASLANNINFMAEELKNKIESERKSERAKSELITNVSHDLRTPLTSIKGYLSLIKDKKYSQDSQLEQYVNIAYSKSEKLEVLINDLFEYTKIANNGVSLEKQNIALNGLLEQLIDELVPISEENNVTISKEFVEEKVIVSVDPNKTMRVFENLLMNAIRYSLKPGKVKVVLYKEEQFALVKVQNNCDNITEEDLEKIFDRFYRVEKSRSTDTGGSGLGLAIAKNIVELQGGEIDVNYNNGYISFNIRFKL
ncbi:HAMP domain-containing histidine kinase [Clostridium sp. CX1]|uniref:sensor histidine kinase n=1 Tax=Clostridium sp. CX1 TaxID=2978346 RepID=UPI0021C091E8|nr:HAMP domain-containing sensor histidine kinase [Clostridium sp. CX1]MCT8976949.1 HAMP domain-containing histidine kinase [Clostridium sp. CX1]